MTDEKSKRYWVGGAMMLYEMHVEGQLDRRWSTWFDPALDDWQRIVVFLIWSVMTGKSTMIIPFFITREDLTMTGARETVESYWAALGHGDFATARALMQDD